MATKRATEPTPTEPGQPAPTLATVVEARSGTTVSRVLIDCGFSARELERRLARAGLALTDLCGIGPSRTVSCGFGKGTQPNAKTYFP